MDRTKKKGNTDMRKDGSSDYADIKRHFESGGCLSVAMYAAMKRPKPTPVTERNYDLIAELAPSSFPVRSHMAVVYKRTLLAAKRAQAGEVRARLLCKRQNTADSLAKSTAKSMSASVCSSWSILPLRSAVGVNMSATQ